MKQVTICKSKTYELESHGNGYAYLLRNKDSHVELFAQGEDATSFIKEFYSHEKAFPAMPNEERLGFFFDQYSPM